MILREFKTKVQELQDSVVIGRDPVLRREFYELFDDLYLFLESRSWPKETLIEHGEPHNEAYFQSVAEGYYRLGYFEAIFYYFSKLVYDLWYQKVLEYQDKYNERIHKGTQVHQIGIILDHLYDKKSAWDYYLAGLIEDLVTDRPMESSQAFRMLRVLGMPKKELETFKTNVQEAGVVFDSLGYISKLRQESPLSTYEENQAVDFNKLKQAEILWEQVLQQKGKKGENDDKPRQYTGGFFGRFLILCPRLYCSQETRLGDGTEKQTRA